MSRNPTELRRRQLAAIHTAKKKLGLDNDTYRDLIERVSGTCGAAVRSAGQLTGPQLFTVLEEFKRLGGLTPSPKTKGKPHNFDTAAMPEMITKVEALLADMKLPWSYADAIVSRQFGIQKVAWCIKEDHLRSLIAALHAEQEKRESLADIEATCVRVGLTLEQLEENYGLPTPRWRRNRDALKTVRERLASEFPQQELAAE